LNKPAEIAQIESWYEQWSKTLYTICLRITGNAQDSEDLMQECFIDAFRKLKQLKNTESQKAWLCAMARNKAINYVQRNKHLYTIDLPTNITPLEEDPEDFNWSELTQNQILAEIDRLPPGYRTICVLFLIEDISHEEIAKTLGISASTSRSQYSRAKKLLQNSLIKHLQHG
jgi:RNA polymerase sigma factor (sigma-70 family)